MMNLSNSINEALKAGYSSDEIGAFLQNDERYKDEYASVLASADNDAKLTFELLRSGKRLGVEQFDKGKGSLIASALPRNDGDKAESDFDKASSWLNPTQAEKYNVDDFYKARTESANSPRFAYDAMSLNSLVKNEKSEDLKAKQDYMNALKSPLKPVEDIIDNVSFGLSSLVADTLTNDDRARGKSLFEKELKKAQKAGTKFEDLSEDLQAHALEKARDEKSILSNPIDTIKNAIDYFTDENLGKELYEKEQNLYNLSRKKYEELSEDEKEQIYKETSPFLSNFVNGKIDKEDFKDFKDYEFAKGVISEEIQEAINTLDIMHNSNNLLNVFNDDKELKKDYLQSAYNIAELSGFDNVAMDKKGGLYFVKENEKGEEAYYKINKGFIDNFKNSLNATKYEIAGSLAGYYIGALKDEGKNLLKAGAKNPFALKKKIPQRLIYSMFGAGAGAGVDYAVNNLALNREGNFEEGMKYLTQAMALDLVANKAGEALAQGIEKVAKGEFKSLYEKPLNLINSTLNNSPFIGFFKRSLGNFLDAQNISGAENIAKSHFSKEQLKDLESALNAFGGSFKVVDERSEALKNADSFLKNKYGENSSFYKGYKGIEKALSLESVKDRQGAIIDLIRADESGVNTQILAQVASQSTEANLALKQALTKASAKLKENLDRLITNKNELKEIFENYEKNTKQSYNEAVEKTIYEVLKGEKIQLDDSNFNQFLDELEQSGYVLDNSHLNFIQSLKNNLYGKEISFENLHAVQKSLNANLKDIKDRNLKSFLQDKIESTLRSDIEKGMQEFFKTKPSLYADLARTFEMASKDYATLKSTIKEAKKQRIYKEGEFKKNIQGIMLSYAKGSKQGIELDKLTQGLSQSEIKDIELSLLDELFRKNLKEFKGNFEVFNANNFLKELENLKMMNLQSNEAKDFIKLTQDFHRLFKNDFELASRIYEPSATESASTLATSVSGAAKVKAVNGIMGLLMRNVSFPNFLSGVNKTFSNEEVGKRALYFHIKRALEKSEGVNDFNTNLITSTSKSNFSNDTLKARDELINAINKTSDEVQEGVKNEVREIELVAEFGENYPQFYHKGGEAVKHLLEKKSGQVQGAFYREDLGDITLPYGNDEIGLKKIVEKHLSDFAPFGDGESGLINGLNEIVENGKLISKNGVNTIIYEKNKEIYKVGLSKGWNGKGDDKWIITAYKKESGETSDHDTFTPKEPLSNLSKDIIPQNEALEQEIKQDLELNLQNNLAKIKEQTRLKKEAEELARIEEERARARALQEERDEIIKTKEARQGLRANSSVDLNLSEAVPFTKIKDTQIILNDRDEPINLSYAVVKKQDIKENFNRTGTQGRANKNENKIKQISQDFKPHLLFGKEGDFAGVPIIAKDGQVISGNHRIAGLKSLNENGTKAYKEAVKEKFNIDLQDDELLIRLYEKDDLDELKNLALMSNVGLENTMGEKALSTLAKYEKAFKDLPSFVRAENVEELKAKIAKTLDKEGNGLNVFDTNLALLSSLAKNSTNNDILSALDNIKGLKFGGFYQ